MRCIDAVTRGSEPGAEVNELRPFGDRIEVTALKHVHSAAEAPDGENHETTLGSGALPDARLRAAASTRSERAQNLNT